MRVLIVDDEPLARTALAQIWLPGPMSSVSIQLATQSKLRSACLNTAMT